jgi:hypothetical protein
LYYKLIDKSKKMKLYRSRINFFTLIVFVMFPLG